MVKTAILVSGGGTNLQAILDAKQAGQLENCEITVVISSTPGVYALERAMRAGIPTKVLDVRTYPDRLAFSNAICKYLVDLGIELVVLAGFLYVLNGTVIERFENRMINIHPALIPSFSGPDCYGLHVHEMVLSYGVKLTGATAHFVTTQADAGPIILQKAVEVYTGDTAKVLQKRVMEQAEQVILPEAIALFCAGRLQVNGRIVSILGEENRGIELLNELKPQA